MWLLTALVFPVLLGLALKRWRYPRKSVWVILVVPLVGGSLVVMDDYVRTWSAWRRYDARVVKMLEGATIESERRVAGIPTRTIYTVSLPNGEHPRSTLIERRDFHWRWYTPRSQIYYVLHTLWFVLIVGLASMLPGGLKRLRERFTASTRG